MSLHDAMERLRERFIGVDGNTPVNDVLSAYDAERANPSAAAKEWRERMDDAHWRIGEMTSGSQAVCNASADIRRLTDEAVRLMSRDTVLAELHAERQRIIEHLGLPVLPGDGGCLDGYPRLSWMVQERLQRLEECRAALHDLMLSFTEGADVTIPGHQVLRAKNALKEAADGE